VEVVVVVAWKLGAARTGIVTAASVLVGKVSELH
jgi:hypothetical protein